MHAHATTARTHVRRNSWNQFDALVVAISLIGVFADYLTSSELQASGAGVKGWRAGNFRPAFGQI
jgi:hypothetical protein